MHQIITMYLINIGLTFNEEASSYQPRLVLTSDKPAIETDATAKAGSHSLAARLLQSVCLNSSGSTK